MKNLVYGFRYIWVLLLLPLWGCATLDQMIICKNADNRSKAIESVKVADGVDAREAEILAGEYFVHYVSGCGSLGPAIDKIDFWVFHPMIGYVAAPMKDEMLIDKKTGMITFAAYPTLENPDKVLLEKVKQGYQKTGCRR